MSIVITAGNGPTTVGNSWAWSPPQMAATGTPTLNVPGQSQTHGISFYTTKSALCIGGQGYWQGAATVRIELWRNSDGSSLANGSAILASAGFANVTWSSAVTLAANTLYTITQCVAGSGSTTSYTVPTGITTPTAPFNAGVGLFINSLSRFNATANTFPNSGGGPNFPTAPVFA